MGTVTVAIVSGPNFGRGIKYARGARGTYNPASKTWTMEITPSVERQLNAPGAYGWRIVSRTDVVAPPAPVSTDPLALDRQWWLMNGYEEADLPNR